MFALVCGSSVATVVAIGSIVLPEMVKRGIPMDFGAAVITVAGSLGILMLPSIPKVIYAIATNTSIGALFVAGLLPGILLTTMLCAVTWYIAKKRNYPRMPRQGWGERLKAFRESVWGLMLVVIIIGGIYSGLFTATEAAAMAAVYAFFVSVFVYKAMPLKDLRKVLLTSANMSAMLLYIITNAALFSFILTNENIPHALADWIIAKNLGWVGFLLLANLLLLMAGNFMEPSSIILIMAPILYPAAITLGINPVHLGILIDVNMEVGLCHPPVGLNLYVASGISRLGITRADQGGHAVAGYDAGVPGHRHLLAGAVHLAAAGDGHDGPLALRARGAGADRALRRSPHPAPSPAAGTKARGSTVI